MFLKRRTTYSADKVVIMTSLLTRVAPVISGRNRHGDGGVEFLEIKLSIYQQSTATCTLHPTPSFHSRGSYRDMSLFTFEKCFRLCFVENIVRLRQRDGFIIRVFSLNQ